MGEGPAVSPSSQPNPLKKKIIMQKLEIAFSIFFFSKYLTDWNRIATETNKQTALGDPYFYKTKFKFILDIGQIPITDGG